MKEFVCLVLLTYLSYVRGEAQGVYITQHWNGGYHGHFTLSPSQALHGWKAHLKFSKPVDTLEVWTANIVSTSADKKEFVLSNKPWTADVNAGSELKVDFNGRAPGDSVPSATIYIEGVDKAPSGGQSSGGGTGTGTGGTPTQGTHTGGGGHETAAPYTGAGGSKMKYDYGKAMSLSILFYDAQRSGRLPDNNPIKWRGNSAMQDSGDGHDLTGGWYDAGDHVKFNLPMAWSAHVLGWGFEKFKDAYKAAGQEDMMYDMLRTPLDYFLKCWIPSSQTYYVQVGDGGQDHSFWGRPEDMHMNRPAFKIDAGRPGSDVAGSTAAALAIGSIIFKTKDAPYSGKLLTAAKSLYAFAKAHPGIYSNSVPQAKNFYGSTSWKDNMCEAAVELYKATKDQQYLNDAKGWFNSGTAWGYSWDDQNAGCQLLLYEVTKEAQYKTAVEGFVNSYKPGGGIPYTPCGLVYRNQWGSNRYAGNAAFIAVMAANDGIGGDDYKKWAMTQINYILGDNNKHISYEIGFGNNFPRQPHHRGASCNPGNCVPAGQNSPHQLNGALVGGPGQNDDYRDDRNDYVKNEVACDYNAGFQGACAGISWLSVLLAEETGVPGENHRPVTSLYHFAVNNQLPPAPASKC